MDKTKFKENEITQTVAPYAQIHSKSIVASDT
jgi:hypothetical protein